MESSLTVSPDGTKGWFNEEGRLHRDDGPAVILPNGAEEWFRHGTRHREDGPAEIYPNGTKIWCQNGFAHREDGTAVILWDGSVQWWLNDKMYSFQEWVNELNLDPKTRLEMVMKWNPE